MRTNVTTPTTKRGQTVAAVNRWGRRQRRKQMWMNLFLLFILAGLLFTLWFFYTPWGKNLRYMMADTLISTQHRHWAKFLIGEQGLEERVAQYMQKFDDWTATESTMEINIRKPEPAVAKKKELIEIKEVEGTNYKGQLVFVHDPTKIRVAVPGAANKGEKVSSMVKRTGAIAGVNGGGFVDPEWKGNGFQPTGIVMSGGEMYYNDGKGDVAQSIVGIDKTGKMIAGKYKPSELKQMGVSEAVTFSPKFIVDGKGLVKSQADGWGIAPRTCMAQKADGTIMFAVIDGRQPGYSIGATLYDIQQLFLENGAVIAANLDGGSSTVLVGKGGEILNKPASPYGERYLPTAFLVFEEPAKAPIRNIWQGIDMSKFDASKW
ncbi:phosphodiester glycosidase family protein [Paenibacillus sp. y28]|uniref:phosphodiester glycosidase family protein n=1 Tax=Paenibacillus sp. y28 TaxID=3129110 RepID=UPI003FA76C34